MLTLLQKTLLYIEKQNDWLLHIQSTIAENERSYQLLHSMITMQIIKELETVIVVDADDGRLEHDEVVVKKEFFDVGFSEENDVFVKSEFDNEESSNNQILYCVNLNEASTSTNAVNESNIDQLVSEEECEENVNVKTHDYNEDNVNESNCDDDFNITKIELSNEKTSECCTENKQIEVVDDQIESSLITFQVLEQDSKQHSINNRKLTSLQCTYCVKTFAHLGNLKRHILIHTGDKPFKCVYCDKAFTDLSNQKQHLRIYTGEKPYKCVYCDKAFNVLGNQKIHMRIHTGEKPIKCLYCDKSFTQLVQQKRHLLLHTGIQTL